MSRPTTGGPSFLGSKGRGTMPLILRDLLRTQNRCDRLASHQLFSRNGNHKFGARKARYQGSEECPNQELLSLCRHLSGHNATRQIQQKLLDMCLNLCEAPKVPSNGVPVRLYRKPHTFIPILGHRSFFIVFFYWVLAGPCFGLHPFRMLRLE